MVWDIAKDFGARSIAGIYVGMKSYTPIFIEYKIYLPTKDVIITSGDVVFSEHTGRTEPEKTPSSADDASTRSKSFLPQDYKYL